MPTPEVEKYSHCPGSNTPLNVLLATSSQDSQTLCPILSLSGYILKDVNIN